MISLTKLRLKNILSYGNAWTEYEFKDGITRISGSNYSGKSTIVDAIYFGLFGRPFRDINIPGLVNSINRKGLIVELYFDQYETKFKITRGLRPAILSIEVDGVDMDLEADKRDSQTWLENEVYFFNMDIFNQIAIRSLTKFESFLTIRKGKKRDIVEKLFGIELLSKMKDINKHALDEAEALQKILEKEKDHIELLIDQEGKNLDRLKEIQERLKTGIEKKNYEKEITITYIKNEVKALKRAQEQFDVEEELLTTRELVREYHTEHEQMLKDVGVINNEIKVIEGKIDFMKSKCADCPKIKDIEQDDDITECRKRHFRLFTDLEEHAYFMLNDEGKLEDLREFTRKYVLIEETITEKNKEIKRLKDSIEEVEDVVQIDETNYNKYLKRLKKIKRDILNNGVLMKYYAVRTGLLTDEAIRSHIIKKYLPLLNKLVNTYLQRFGIDLEMAFDSSLDIVIKTKFKEDYKYDNFSEGEKKRIDLAITFTFLEFCKVKHSNANINILILDEFNTGLDSEGESVMYTILKDISAKENKEVLTITHSSQIDPDNINHHYIAKLERGFSKLELVEDVA